MKAGEVTKALSKEYGKPKIMLRHKNPIQLLVSVILSAQCTDVRVNMVTKELFKKYKTINDFANAKQTVFEKEIFSTGFYRNKAKNIIAAAGMIRDEFDGIVPDTMEEIIKLPGVGRKTGNIVLSNVYGKHLGIAVDTHVGRLSYRLGLSNHKNPEKVEQDLIKLYPKKEWNTLTYLLIEHGRAVCKAPTPICSSCVMQKTCPRNGVVKYK